MTYLGETDCVGCVGVSAQIRLHCALTLCVLGLEWLKDWLLSALRDDVEAVGGWLALARRLGGAALEALLGHIETATHAHGVRLGLLACVLRREGLLAVAGAVLSSLLLLRGVGLAAAAVHGKIV